MLHIKLVVVGKLREEFLRAGCAEYLKRLSRYARVDLMELKEENGTGSARAREEERLKAAVVGQTYIVALDSGGRQCSSPELAGFISSAGETGHGAICFVIGGADGLPLAIKDNAQLTLSFGRLTYPHQLFRLIFLEQLYRAFTIINGEPYHCGH